MNSFIEIQCKNMDLQHEQFIKGLKISATNNDGSISKEEEKIIKQIEKASTRFLKEINRIIGKNG